MKLITALVGLIIVVSVNALTEEQRQRALGYVKKCKTEVGLDDGTASKVRAGNFTDAASDHKAKCFVKCYFRETGFMNEKGEPQRDVIISKLVSRHGLDREFVTDLVDKCIKEKGNDDCESAFNIFQCYRKNRVIRNKIQSYTASPAGASTTASGSSTKASSLGGSSSTTSATPVSTSNAGSSSTTPVSTTKAASTTSSSWFGK